jgi:hypothetical protein
MKAFKRLRSDYIKSTDYSFKAKFLKKMLLEQMFWRRAKCHTDEKSQYYFWCQSYKPFLSVIYDFWL